MYLGTYNQFPGQTSNTSCIDCPAGSFCNATGIFNPDNWLCPPGYYCLKKTTNPYVCPPGTYRDRVNATSSADCFTCPTGRYCPEGSVDTKPCPATRFCQEGTSNVTQSSLCPPKYYCPEGAVAPIICPAGYYCPKGTGDNYKPCIRGTYCPSGTDIPIYCPLGYKTTFSANATFMDFSSNSTACTVCPAGYYGNDPNRLVCYTGTPGYVFLEGATTSKPTNNITERGYICPVGHYCEAKTSVPQSCPAGMYQPLEGMKNVTSCAPCASGSYQNQKGQGQCLRCSSSSQSVIGATT